MERFSPVYCEQHPTREFAVLETAPTLPSAVHATMDAHRFALIVCGPDGYHAAPLDGQTDVVIGRDSSCELSLTYSTLSRCHARFSARSGVVVVEDLNSRHGTWVANERVERAVLKVGDSVRLADIAVIVAKDACAGPYSSSATEPALVPSALYLSPGMREVHALLHRVAKTNLPVLLLGETGTGKELAAREVHLASARKGGPLRVLNCAAIPANLIESTLFGHERGAFTSAERTRAGVFEAARGGTVFLDEVGELSLATQAALLRVLETGRVTRVGSSTEIEVDVRVIAATNRDLNAMAEHGQIRADFLHRLSVLVVELPPLRRRREEIAALASHFVAQEDRARTLAPEVLTRLMQHDWPGNVRELRNALARAAALATGSVITVRDLPEYLRRPPVHAVQAKVPAEGALPVRESLRAQLKRIENAKLLNALEATGGNQRQAAALLHLPLRTFERRLRALRDG
jgi:two-component system, NtrC family, response regulator AtoC